MRAGDEPALRAAHARQCAALGLAFACPDLRDPHYVFAAVAERDGRVLGAIAAHATLELMFIGGDALMVRGAIEQQDTLAEGLRSLGADEVHAFVPRSALRGMEPLLRRVGLRRSNADYIPFYRPL